MNNPIKTTQSSRYNYQLNCGQYVLFDGDKPVGRVLDEVAIAFDRENAVRHKHGDPVEVRAWLKNAQEKFRKGGFDSMADDLTILQGRFTLDDLQKCLDNSGYVLRLYNQVLSGKASSLDLMGNVISPD